MAVIAGAHDFFIERGEPGSEEALIEALDKSDDLEMKMVNAFLNCGNAKLEQAANDWATQKGYEVQTLPTGMTMGSSKWGRAR